MYRRPERSVVVGEDIVCQVMVMYNIWRYRASDNAFHIKGRYFSPEIGIYGVGMAYLGKYRIVISYTMRSSVAAKKTVSEESTIQYIGWTTVQREKYSKS